MTFESDIIYPQGCISIPVGSNNNDMIRKLKPLATALQETEQNESNAQKYRNLAVHLAHPSFLKIISRETRILLACSIADLFRIFAPDSPYGDPIVLKDILLFLIQSLRGLDSPKDPQYRRYFYLLENLAIVKSLQLTLELDDEHVQEILKQLVKCALRIMSSVNSEQTENEGKIQTFLTDLLVPLIQGADQISAPVLDALFFYIINPQKSQNENSYNMAKDLLQRCQTSFEPCINFYLNQALLTGILPSCEMVRREKMYDLIYELFLITPELFYAILPQLGDKLLTSNDKIRLSSTDLLGRLFSAPHSTIVEDYPTLWTGYLDRFNDVKSEVRLKCVEQSSQLLVTQAALRGQLSDALVMRSHDTEESIRLAYVISVASAAKKQFDAVNDKLLENLAERTMDKKLKVGKEARLSLATLYRKMICSEEFTESERSSLKWIPIKLLNAYYMASIEKKIFVENLVCTCMVPYKLEPDRRMMLMLEMYCSLDLSASKVFDEILRQQNRVRTMVRNVLELLENADLKHDEKESQLKVKLKQLADCQSDPGRTLEIYQRFFGQFLVDNRRAFHLLKYIVGYDYCTRKVEESVGELLTKFDNDHVIKALMERVSPLIVDNEAIGILVRRVRQMVENENTADESLSSSAFLLLIVLSETFPYTFRDETTLEFLRYLLNSDNDIVVENAIKVITNIGPDSAKNFENFYSELFSKLQLIAKNGTPKQAKYAVRCVGKVAGDVEKEELLDHIFNHCLPNVDADNCHCATALNSLSIVAQIRVSPYRVRMKTMLRTVLVSSIILRAPSQDVVDDDTQSVQWTDWENLSMQCKAKIAAMKFMTRYFRAIQTNEDQLVSKTMKLLAAFPQTGGDVHMTNCISLSEKSHLRLTAACCMLKLAEFPPFAKLIQLDYFQEIAELVCDECTEVRNYFVLKLHNGLLKMRLPVEYLAIFSLSALLKGDVHKLYRDQVRNCFTICVKKRRDYLRSRPEAQEMLPYFMPEYCVAYAVHLLAHNKRYRTRNELAILNDLKECLWFLLEGFWKNKEVSNNFPFLYRIFQDVKNSVDVQKPSEEMTEDEQNEKMWALCDVGMLLLSYRIPIVIKDMPTKSVLSTRFFRHNSHGNVALYIPDQVIDEEKRRFGRHKPTTVKVNANSEMNDRAVEGTSGKKQKQKQKRKRKRAPVVMMVEEADQKQKQVHQEPLRRQPRRAAKDSSFVCRSVSIANSP